MFRCILKKRNRLVNGSDDIIVSQKLMSEPKRGLQKGQHAEERQLVLWNILIFLSVIVLLGCVVWLWLPDIMKQANRQGLL